MIHAGGHIEAEELIGARLSTLDPEMACDAEAILALTLITLAVAVLGCTLALSISVRATKPS